MLSIFTLYRKIQVESQRCYFWCRTHNFNWRWIRLKKPRPLRYLPQNTNMYFFVCICFPKSSMVIYWYCLRFYFAICTYLFHKKSSSSLLIYYLCIFQLEVWNLSNLFCRIIKHSRQNLWQMDFFCLKTLL